MKKQISTEQTQENIEKVLALLAETHPKLEALSTELSEQLLLTPLGPGERSVKGILVHILNCDSRTFEAMTQSLLTKEPTLAPIHPERDFGKLFQLEQMTFPELMVYFKFRRTVLLRVLSNLTDKKWARTCQQGGKNRNESIYWQARGQALHELDHLQDIEKKLPNTG